MSLSQPSRTIVVEPLEEPAREPPPRPHAPPQRTEAPAPPAETPAAR